MGRNRFSIVPAAQDTETYSRWMTRKGRRSSSDAARLSSVAAVAVRPARSTADSAASARQVQTAKTRRQAVKFWSFRLIRSDKVSSVIAGAAVLAICLILGLGFTSFVFVYFL